MQLDAIVVGGSFAGIAAAMQLARARRQVVVVDAGRRRNRFAATSHGFFGQDGRAPGAIIAEARAQLLAYPNVRWVDATAQSAERRDDGFAVTTPPETLHAKRLVLATGIVDELPSIDGLAERWGRSVFHCPYCHGYELENGRIGVLATSGMAIHHAMMLPDWGRVTLFLNDAFEPDAAQTTALAARGVSIERGRVTRVSETATIELDDSRRFPLDGIFTLGRTHMASPLAEQLGCEFDQGAIGPHVRRGENLQTTVQGVFACGDAARAFGNVAIAVGDGTLAGASAHQSMIFGT